MPYQSVMLEGSPAPATMNSNRRVVNRSISAVAEGWLGADDVDVGDEVTTELVPSEELVTAADDGAGVNDVDTLSVALAELAETVADDNDELVENTYSRSEYYTVLRDRSTHQGRIATRRGI